MIERYQMMTKNDCGPKCLSFVTQLSDSVIEEAWGITDINNFADVRDTPWHHFYVLEKLGIPYTVIPLSEVLKPPLGKTNRVGKTIVLYHFDKLIAQHWIAILHSDTQDIIFFYDGVSKTPITMNFANFTKAYSDGIPACAYVVGEDGGKRLTAFQNFCVWLTNTFCGSISTWIFRKISRIIFLAFGQFS